MTSRKKKKKKFGFDMSTKEVVQTTAGVVILSSAMSALKK
jgi:hypothetical protein